MARLPSRMEWSQPDVPSRLANCSRPEPIHRCIWYNEIWSLFQRSMDHGHMVKEAALKVNPMERTFCNRHSGCHLGNKWQRQKIVVYCDNQAIVPVASKNPKKLSCAARFINRHGGYITLVRCNVHGLKIVVSLLLLH